MQLARQHDVLIMENRNVTRGRLRRRTMIASDTPDFPVIDDRWQPVLPEDRWVLTSG